MSTVQIGAKKQSRNIKQSNRNGADIVERYVFSNICSMLFIIDGGTMNKCIEVDVNTVEESNGLNDDWYIVPNVWSRRLEFLLAIFVLVLDQIYITCMHTSMQQ